MKTKQPKPVRAWALYDVGSRGGELVCVAVGFTKSPCRLYRPVCIVPAATYLALVRAAKKGGK